MNVMALLPSTNDGTSKIPNNNINNFNRPPPHQPQIMLGKRPNHPNQQRRFSVGWPVALVMVYMLWLLMYTSRLQVNTNEIGGSVTNVDMSLLPRLLPPGQKSIANTRSNKGVRHLKNNWDQDRDYWIDHIQQRQHYVKGILNRVPMDVQNVSRRGYGEPAQCRARRKMFGNDLSVLDTFDQNQTTKHAIVIPFRDRDYHLKHFQKYMSSYLQHHYDNTNHTFKLYILEQDDQEPFQRGFLMNAALDHLDHDVSCVTMHDVDLVPIFFSPVPYHTCDRPIRLINKMQTYDWKIPYDHYFGGIVSMHQQHWAVINGMGNQFRGWGAEDDELYQRLVYRSLVNCTNGNPATPSNGDHGNFMAISQDTQHHQARVFGKDYQWNCHLMDRHKWTGVSNSLVDGWSLNRYEVNSHDIQYTKNDPLLKGFAEIHTIRVVNRIQKLPLRMLRPVPTGKILIDRKNPRNPNVATTNPATKRQAEPIIMIAASNSSQQQAQPQSKQQQRQQRQQRQKHIEHVIPVTTQQHVQEKFVINQTLKTTTLLRKENIITNQTLVIPATQQIQDQDVSTITEQLQQNQNETSVHAEDTLETTTLPRKENIITNQTLVIPATQQIQDQDVSTITEQLQQNQNETSVHAEDTLDTTPPRKENFITNQTLVIPATQQMQDQDVSTITEQVQQNQNETSVHAKDTLETTTLPRKENIITNQTLVIPATQQIQDQDVSTITEQVQQNQNETSVHAKDTLETTTLPRKENIITNQTLVIPATQQMQDQDVSTITEQVQQNQNETSVHAKDTLETTTLPRKENIITNQTLVIPATQQMQDQDVSTITEQVQQNQNETSVHAKDTLETTTLPRKENIITNQTLVIPATQQIQDQDVSTITEQVQQNQNETSVHAKDTLETTTPPRKENIVTNQTLVIPATQQIQDQDVSTITEQLQQNQNETSVHAKDTLDTINTTSSS
ncbi:glycosyl transferase group 7 protein [Nitzschia inconspicua]|uniref:Glycosyl transferase group 7 protein n=1 Tax=Nitzschia inconspicua TaxID=303405 RepID=A0A9K3KDE1_9STRA|nr:glycosyl transferase group 7 protein [Nitzschia inconspicua]